MLWQVAVCGFLQLPGQRPSPENQSLPKNILFNSCSSLKSENSCRWAGQRNEAILFATAKQPGNFMHLICRTPAVACWRADVQPAPYPNCLACQLEQFASTWPLQPGWCPVGLAPMATNTLSWRINQELLTCVDASAWDALARPAGDKAILLHMYSDVSQAPYYRKVIVRHSMNVSEKHTGFFSFNF